MPVDQSPQPAPRYARAVVFGACGFLGREVVRLLLASGASVLGIDTKPWPGAQPREYRHSAEGAGALAEAAEFLRQTDEPAGFFHLAGLADAQVCQREPALAQRLNVDLVAETLARLADVPCAFVFPSTGIVYGDGLDRPALEDDPLLPAAEYARGKIEAEGLVRAACQPGGGVLRGAVARLSNIYGYGGGENTVLGRILAQVKSGGPIQVWDESPVRDFLFVGDAAEGLLKLGLAALSLPEKPGNFLIANLSTGLGTSVGALVDLCAELFHTSRLPQERVPGPDGRLSSLVLDNSRLTTLTGWRPETDLRTGLTLSIRGEGAAQE